MPPLYDLYGLKVRCELPLGARVCSQNGEAVDCEVLLGEPHAVNCEPPAGRVVHRRVWNEKQGYSVTRHDGGHILRIHNICDFQISGDLRCVTAHVAPSGMHPLVPLLIQCSLVAFLLDLAGETTLHASAVLIDGRVIAFASNANGGKSTLAALLCQRAGGRLVTDDLLRLQQDGDALRCVAGPPELRLRESADWLAEGFDPSVKHLSADRRTTIRAVEQCTDRSPLAAVVFPKPSREIDRPQVTRLKPSQAIYHLLGQLRTMISSDRPERLKHQFEWCSRLATRVPIYDATLPWGPPIEDEVWRSLVKLSRRNPAPCVVSPHSP